MIRATKLLVLAFTFGAGASSAADGQFVVRPDGRGLDTSSVSISASAEARLSPDRAVVSFQVISTGDSPEVAALSNGEARARTIEALGRLGFSTEDVALWGYGAGPAASAGYGPPPSGGSASYEAKSGLRVVVEPLERLDPVVSTALVAGATISTVEFESDGLETALRTASERAVSQARAQAEAMATAAGGRLGDLLSLVTTPDYNTMSAEQRYMYAGPPGSQGVQLFPWEGSVRVTVQATWAFVSR